MRLTPEQIQGIRRIARHLAGEAVTVRVFGSRLDDNARGGDLDLLLELPDPVAEPARLAAQVSAQTSRLIMEGRKVDVVLCAPKLRRLPIHEVALKEGQRLYMSAGNPKPRLTLLTCVLRKECRHLLTADQRLFDQTFTR